MADIPTLITLHLPPAFYPAWALRPSRPATWLHCVSSAQHQACPSDLRLLPPIENGVPVQTFAGRHCKRGFALALGRICPEKGFHLALQAAKLAGLPLLLGGEVFPHAEHRRYFDSEIVPRLDRYRRFLGPVNFARKRRLLAAAQCLVVPSLVAETSSLVGMEALASGTPVVASGTGALADIVEHGRTGFIAKTEGEMADAMTQCRALDPASCQQSARQRFSLDRMVARYLDVYAHLARYRGCEAAPAATLCA